MAEMRDSMSRGIICPGIPTDATNTNSFLEISSFNGNYLVLRLTFGIQIRLQLAAALIWTLSALHNSSVGKIVVLIYRNNTLSKTLSNAYGVLIFSTRAGKCEASGYVRVEGRRDCDVR